jgi:hypothetical protein
MVYITEADFSPMMRQEFLDAIIDEDASVLAEAELQTMALVESWLNDLYDMAAEWNHTGTARNRYLVQLMVNIIRYDIWQRLPKGIVAANVQAGKDEAMDWLKRVSGGDISAQLPKKMVDDQPVTRTRWGSEPRKRWDTL